MPETIPAKPMDELVALCRRRGFIFQSSEMYGGINGFWDYGPLGVELKRNLKEAWWQDIVRCPPNGPDGKPIEVVGLDTTIIMNARVWEASGHVGGFNDPMQTCRQCKKLFRADQVDDALKDSAWVKSFADACASGASSDELDFDEATVRKWAQKHGRKLAPGLALVRHPKTMLERLVAQLEGSLNLDTMIQRVATEDPESTGLMTPCPNCGGDLTEPREFNLMFQTYHGAVFDQEHKTYLRPETAQGIFVNFRNIIDTSRVKVPFGIAQIGKAFRNEVTPRNFTFRSREFEQMEIEFFIHPSEAQAWYTYWTDARFKWWQSLGLSGENLSLRPHDKDELSHYAKEGAGTSDVEYRFPFTAPGFGELEGIAHRTDFDLRAHAQSSGLGDKLKYFDQDRNERYFPHVIEPSAGADRGALALLCEAFTPDPSRPSKVYMNFAPRLAPIKTAVFPLVNKDGMPDIAEKLYLDLRRQRACQFDVKQSIGKRYARMDEAGTPYCFTIDGQTLEDQTVTVRDRNTQQQQRIGIGHVAAYLDEKIA